MLLQSIFFIFGGVALFLYGIHLLSTGLQKASGDRFRKMLETLTRNRITGILLGAGFTGILQSSGAVTIMAVSFVNAGLFSLKQAISIIIGANIGTTITAWIVAYIASFNLLNFLLPVIAIGVMLMLSGKNKRAQLTGEVLLGFGILFLGLDFMKQVADPLKESENIINAIRVISDYPLLGIIAGIILTMIFQSSSAAIALIQTIAFSGIISFPFALGFILGSNIGTTFTTQIGAINTNVNARRAAMAHILFNFIGVLYFSIFLFTGIFQRFTEYIVPGDLNSESIMTHIAASHSLFNIINAIIFLPLIGLLTKICIVLIKEKNNGKKQTNLYLNSKLLSTPNLAIEQVKRELIHMTRIAQKAFRSSFEYILNNQNGVLAHKILKKEHLIDKLQGEITLYLIDIQERVLTNEEARQMPCFLHSVNDLEKIGDYAEDILNLSEQMKKARQKFDEETLTHLKKVFLEIDGLFSTIIETIYSRNKKQISEAFEAIAKIRTLKKNLQQELLKKDSRHKNQLQATGNLLNLLFSFEKITAHLKNIAETVKIDYRWRDKKN